MNNNIIIDVKNEEEEEELPSYSSEQNSKLKKNSPYKILLHIYQILSAFLLFFSLFTLKKDSNDEEITKKITLLMVSLFTTFILHGFNNLVKYTMYDDYGLFSLREIAALCNIFIFFICAQITYNSITPNIILTIYEIII